MWSWGSPAREVRCTKAAPTSPCAPMRRSPPAPRRTQQRPALEVVEGLGDGVGVHGADGGRDVAVREAVEEGDRFGGREGQVEARHPSGVGHPARGQDLAVGRDAGEDGSEIGRRHLAAQSEEPRHPPPASSRGTRPTPV